MKSIRMIEVLIINIRVRVAPANICELRKILIRYRRLVGMPKEERHTLLTFYKSLVTHVKAPEIMDQLVKADVFNNEDRIRVFLSEKNRERMDALLRILLTKSASAYTEFCKPIKFKHAHLFELMNRTYSTLKRQSAFKKPGERNERSGYPG